MESGPVVGHVGAFTYVPISQLPSASTLRTSGTLGGKTAASVVVHIGHFLIYVYIHTHFCYFAPVSIIFIFLT